MREISRDIEDLVGHAIGRHHAYPDGLVLFCGTMFAPVIDRGAPGQGFTHHRGDIVAISTGTLGTLANRIEDCTQIPPWDFGVGALLRNLSARRLL
jgi:fumarylacetoacetate (FAA) hydrolase family protein